MLNIWILVKLFISLQSNSEIVNFSIENTIVAG